ncbi:ATP-binding cassette domain-containing protein [Pseudoalteromonas shioyasakiensis]|uniref:ATP-binding cassette domain-containing protein n=1 Tax=Pseudoalteromonas shioyasakiensis TaxID=1190813 RepID=UPI00211935F9|nr:ATP-binding cassette domain-containing protein [Pseudoalteromonas shioyasakiensis]MCQ8878780.1 ATP-binding cassette domain-containing protein [Pseudoalteromonas shioyasakiensis]
MLKVNINYPLSEFTLCAELAIEQGTIQGIYGPSGAGKSCLLACISGQIKGQRIFNNGIELTNLSSEQKGISHQLQSSQLFPHLDVAENLKFACKHRPKTNNQISFTEVIEQLEIGALLQRNVSSLSGGETQRVTFARTLLVGQNIILLDEPFAALDWQKRYIMLNAIRYFASTKNITFLFVSHSLRELSFCCDQLLQLINGRVVNKDAIQQAVNAITLQQAFTPFSYLKVDEVEFLKEHQLYKLTLKDSQQFIYTNLASVVVTHSLCINADRVNLLQSIDKNKANINILCCTYQRVYIEGNKAVVHLDICGQSLICILTTLEWQIYAFTEGQTVYAQIPVHTVDE